MENIAEALKLFFGVTVFAIALSVFFQMTALAKDTSDIVFAAIDKTTFINYNADTRDLGNRKVTFQEIIPTIYRYSREAYGVTIIDDGDIAARFDLDTESQLASFVWTRDWSTDDSNPGNIIKEEIIEYYNKYIVENIEENVDGIKRLNRDNFHSVIEKIYYTGDPNAPVFTAWETSNTFKDNDIALRVNCDIYGLHATNAVTDEAGITRFLQAERGVNTTDPDETIRGQHKAPFGGNGLLYAYSSPDITFTEYIVQIDRNEYIIDEDGENTGLLEFGTLRNTKKREIVYVKN